MRSTQLLHSEFTAAIEMLRLTRHSIWAAFFGLLTTTHVVPAAAEELPPPPYFVSKTDAVVIGIAYDESRIKKLSPSGLQVAPGATGQIIMYAAEDSYGLPAYSSSFMAVDLEGFDAPGGAKGRWMLAGLYSPGSVTAALAKYFNYPVREGVTRLEHQGQRVIAVGTMGGREMIRASHRTHLQTEISVVLAVRNDARAYRGAWQAGYGLRNRAVPAPIPRSRDGSGPDLAIHHVRD